ncbi:hypothetical protein BpHYR1_037036 [Brachionus plicatilis]|uniref:Uncharacterized protein n=1 Tax=Brachionus plicatilis TaxID=10195 RepID=A0A3M7SMR9_BRAPC|nr:hypothetical protein BpHYR1_037036 [Brachionus plicatilis]
MKFVNGWEKNEINLIENFVNFYMNYNVQAWNEVLNLTCKHNCFKSTLSLKLESKIENKNETNVKIDKLNKKIDIDISE